MIEQTPPDHISRKLVVYQMPGMSEVIIQTNIEYRTTDAGTLTMDVYAPPRTAKAPAVVIVAGYPDPGFQKMVGCKFKELGSSVSWAKLMAASGLKAITYTNRQPAEDLTALLEHVRRSSSSLGIDENRIGLWASSGNVPLALSALIEKNRSYLKCAAFCYGYMMDLDGSTSVAEMSPKFGFVNPCAGKTIGDLPANTPIFVARAGKDETPLLNETMDRFLGKALASNLPLTIVNHHSGPHAFDIYDDSNTSREIIKQILAFLRFQLLA